MKYYYMVKCILITVIKIEILLEIIEISLCLDNNNLPKIVISLNSANYRIIKGYQNSISSYSSIYINQLKHTL
jgi:hypothetical protein